jgi:hypothetical protein
VIVHLDSLIGKAGSRKILVVAGKPMLNDATQKGLVAGSRYLLFSGQSRGIDVGRARHAQRSSFQGHKLGEFLFAAADGFSDNYRGVVRGFGNKSLYRILNLDGLIDLEPQLGWVLECRLGRDRQRCVKLEIAVLKLLEKQVKRHNFRQRCRMTRFVRTDPVQHETRFVIDHDGRIQWSIIGTVNHALWEIVARRTSLRLIPPGAGNR